jgi:hypothetical protein
MPFDSTPTPVITPEQRFIDDVLAAMGPNGERWRPHNCNSTPLKNSGHGCLVNHVGYNYQRAGGGDESFARYGRVMDALSRVVGVPRDELFLWNDRQPSFEPVREALLGARQLLGGKLY